MKRKLFSLFLGFLIPFQIWGLSVKDAYPNPSLNPSDVVKMQLAAMQQNDASHLGSKSHSVSPPPQIGVILAP